MNGLRNMPMINGAEYGWSSVTTNIAGLAETGITAIEYADKQKVENIYGAGQSPIGRGYGRIEASAKITLLLSAVESLREVSATGRLQDLPAFDIIVCYVVPGNDKIVKHVIKNCQFSENAMSAKEGDTKLEVTLPLVPSHIIWNA
ncbi:MAG: hypothetical protein FWH39_01635 [Bacteroidales bacterium]|nr:hypothetical protein [Bacteroidales bacterium]